MTSSSGQAKWRTENPKAISKQVNKKFRPAKQTKLSLALIWGMKYSVIKVSKLEITHSMHGSYKWIITHEKCGCQDSNGF